MKGIKTFTAVIALAMTYDNQFIIIGSQDRLFKAIIRETGKIHHIFSDILHDPINIYRGIFFLIGCSIY